MVLLSQGTPQLLRFHLAHSVHSRTSFCGYTSLVASSGQQLQMTLALACEICLSLGPIHRPTRIPNNAIRMMRHQGRILKRRTIHRLVDSLRSIVNLNTMPPIRFVEYRRATACRTRSHLPPNAPRWAAEALIPCGPATSACNPARLWRVATIEHRAIPIAGHNLSRAS